ncbi:hypothetical protein N8Z47_00345 [Salibacteraceae bacterium]|nr:hypothetical protein [Salibacteraceae bacterium]
MTNRFESNPRRIFLIDGTGALLSAFMLGFVLVTLERVIGIPSSTLFFLAIWPVGFAIYDFYCYRFKKDNFGPFLYCIAIINLLYCVLSAGFGLYHFETITWLGSSYLMFELLIVMSLAFIEFLVAYRTTNQDQQ